MTGLKKFCHGIQSLINEICTHLISNNKYYGLFKIKRGLAQCWWIKVGSFPVVLVTCWSGAETFRVNENPLKVPDCKTRVLFHSLHCTVCEGQLSYADA